MREPRGLSDAESFLADMKSMADAYNRRYEAPAGPIIYLAPDWAFPRMLADLEAEGRPGTRAELDRWASDFLGYECVIRKFDEQVPSG